MSTRKPVQPTSESAVETAAPLAEPSTLVSGVTPGTEDAEDEDEDDEETDEDEDEDGDGDSED